ncbi:MAG: hypothetical protein K2W95_32225 [Candidatus Obscuribacterales bacterium]|nr:hypothetical protein [Candidatus Obscuribacterales bacterium]
MSVFLFAIVKRRNCHFQLQSRYRPHQLLRKRVRGTLLIASTGARNKMQDFAYLQKLTVLTEQQRAAIVNQGLYKTARSLFNAVSQNPHGFRNWCYPLDVEAVRNMLWQLLTDEEKKSFEPTKGDKVASVVRDIIFIAIAVLLIAMLRVGCEQILLLR